MAVRQIVDIIENIVSQLNHTFLIDSVTDLTGSYRLDSDNTYYCTKLNTVTIGGLDYTIIDVDFNVSITVQPLNHAGNPLAETSFELSSPSFFHGTVNSTDPEILKAIVSGVSTYPIVYLNEVLREQMVADPESSIERFSPIRIFFLDISNYADNLNKDFLDDVLKPLSNIESKFYDVIDKDANIGLIEADWDRINLPRFARVGENGETELIFSEELSGLELGITIPIKKCCDC